MPILPVIRDGFIQIPVITLMLTYFAEGCCLFWLYGTVVITMGIENIPPEYVVPSIVSIVATAVVLYVVFYLVSYQAKKSKTLALQADALKNGTVMDEIALKRVENFHLIYKIAMFLGIIVVSAIAFVAFATAVAGHINLVGDDHLVKACAYSAGTCFLTFLVFDYLIGRPIADGTFKAKVLDPLEEQVIAQFQTADGDSAQELDPQQAIYALNNIAEALAKIKTK